MNRYYDKDADLSIIQGKKVASDWLWFTRTRSS